MFDTSLARNEVTPCWVLGGEGILSAFSCLQHG